ncbi:DUF4129 domain-containing protein [Nocardia sp. NBC_01009]|uniref:DUF4129 domain-containing protein n=1 Tax=Nocardia sp. NBC_01009 TaxID=2975996 RepID=UPI00386E70E0|nr:DUF4129 domain-containing protein [Nocardia sp. NBC_01009]
MTDAEHPTDNLTPETWPPVHEPAAPPPPRLGAAAHHRAAAESAAEHRDFDAALRERFRAVLRGLEQGGLLEVRRSRTARETADDATTVLPLEAATELHPAAYSFDEIVYGGRHATEDEYRSLEYADRYSGAAPPPAPEPAEVAVTEKPPRTRRQRPPLPELLRSPKFWVGLAGVVVLLLLLYAMLNACGAPDPQTPQKPPRMPPPTDYPDSPDIDAPGAGAGQDSIFSRLPGPVAFGGLQFLIAAALLVWWRARRRGALVGEPRPVEVAANELLAGQAALYRRSKDYEHVASKLRAATLRRIRPHLGATAETTPDRLIAAVSTRIGADPSMVGSTLYGPVPDTDTLHLVAAQLEWIEAEVG